MVHYPDPIKTPPEEPIVPGSFWALLAGIIIGFIMATCVSCTTTKYVPVEYHTTDTLYKSRVERDSIWLHDSIHVSEKQKGDTVWLTTERWRTHYVDRWRVDTVYQSHTDSIPYPVEVPVEVPAQLTWWQELRIHLGGFTFWLLVILCGVGAFRILRKVHII